MPVSLTSSEEAQLSQTIEMFEVITQSQPLDCQSLEILKEAYLKLGRHKDTVRTSKRIAEAYLHLGQLSSAILEYESILQGYPGDPDVQQALAQIELKASNLSTPKPGSEPDDKAPTPSPPPARKSEKPGPPAAVEDGRQQMQKIFVDGKQLSQADFNHHWPAVDPHSSPKQAVEPFIQVLADRQLLPLDVSMKLLLEKSRHCYLPIEKYDVDVELARGFPRDTCRRWCVLPFDRMSKSILIATANPFNQQVVRELHEFTKSRLLWYVASPLELMKLLAKTYR